MEEVLVNCVCASLRLYMYSNATFLCERLYASYATESNLHLLATCYYRANQPQRAYYILKGAKSTQCRYLFALCCYDLKRLAEAEAALSPANEPTSEVPNGAAGCYLLGVICRQTDRRQAAISHLATALSMDPFLWVAYEELCALGAETEAENAYGDAAITALQAGQSSGAALFSLGSGGGRSMSAVDAYDAKHRETGSGLPPGTDARAPASGAASQSQSLGDLTATPLFGTPITPLPISPSSFSTPAASTGEGGGVPVSAAPPMMPVRVPALGRAGTGAGDGASPRTGGGGGPAAGGTSGVDHRRKFVDKGKLRKVSGRLFAEPPLSSVRRSSRLAAHSSEGGAPTAVGGVGGAAGGAGGPGGGPVTAAGTGGQGVRIGSAGVPGSTNRTTSSGRRSTGASSQPPDDASGAIASDAKGAVASPADSAGSSGSRPSSRTGRSSGGDEGTTAGPAAGGKTKRDSGGGGGEKRKAGRLPSGVVEVLGLLRVLGCGLRKLCVFECKEAVEAFQKLSVEHYATGWVLCQVGRAWFEMVDYSEAERAFGWARRVCPHRLEGMDVYSTVLWHMKKDTDLSYLAQEAVALDRLSPQAWCILGNSFSLQREHETALRFFQRALQLDPSFTYAHTLSGHEYVAIEDFDEGLGAYRHAIRNDPRHYNAWYGLGTIYYRQEKYELAEYHFRRALLINRHSSVLHCYLGMALHALKRNREALEFLQKAIDIDSKNPLPKFERAGVLLSEERYDDAIAELEQLKEVAPREASVYFLMGKIYKKMGQPDRAMLQFSTALDLKPSSADVNLIKSAIEKLHVPEDAEEDEL